MKGEDKTKKQLVSELTALRQRIAELEESETERKPAEVALKEQCKFLRSVINTVPYPIFYKNTEGKYIDCNKAFEEFIGRKKDEIVGKTVYDMEPKEIADKLNEKDKELFHDPGSQVFETRVKNKDGQIKAVIFNKATFLDVNNNVSGLTGIISDVTQWRQAEENIKKLAKFPGEDPNPVLWVAEDGTVLYFNEAGVPLLNIWGCWPSQLLPDRWRAFVRDVLESGSRKLAEVSCEDHTFALTFTPVMDAKYVNIYGIDITERKRAEEKLRRSDEKYKELADALPQIVFETDTAGKLTYANRKAFDLFSYTQKDFDKGLSALQMVVPEERYRAERNIRSILSGAETADSKEYTAQKKNGSTFRIEIHSSLIVDDNKPVGLRGIIVDITERKRAEEAIKASLKEKELLLRELHHRVKNNLQIMSSLINFQLGYLRDKMGVEVLKELQNRLKSMSLIHEKLYKSKDLVHIDFNEYIWDLIKALYRTYGVNRARIRLEMAVKDVSLTINVAVPCALIINELVSNSLKHAFPKGKGKITIALSPAGKDEIELAVSDNGVGVSKDFDFRKTKSLGLQLVTILAEEQLHGKMELDRTEGTAFKMKLRVS